MMQDNLDCGIAPSAVNVHGHPSASGDLILQAPSVGPKRHASEEQQPPHQAKRQRRDSESGGKLLYDIPLVAEDGVQPEVTSGSPLSCGSLGSVTVRGEPSPLHPQGEGYQPGPTEHTPFRLFVPCYELGQEDGASHSRADDEPNYDDYLDFSQCEDSRAECRGELPEPTTRCSPDNTAISNCQESESKSGVAKNGEHEDYFAQFSDEEMVKLIDAASPLLPQMPPSSVIKEMDASSDDIFDPTLKRSPPSSSANQIGNMQPKEQEVISDHEVHWDEIMSTLPYAPKGPSLPSTQDKIAVVEPPRPLLPTPITSSATVAASGPGPSLRRSPRDHKSFTRSKYPSVMKDHSRVQGFSNASLLQTCFRIGEMVNEASKSHKAKQDIAFELYARVTDSSRAGTARIQRFTFMDLLSVHPPYPNGSLSGWATDGVMDFQSAAFLSCTEGDSRSEPVRKMCRCICKLKKDSKAEMGWTMVVLCIREVDWDEINLVKKIVCRE